MANNEQNNSNSARRQFLAQVATGSVAAGAAAALPALAQNSKEDRKSTRLNSSHT